MIKRLLWLLAALPALACAGQTRVVPDIGLLGIDIRAATEINADPRTVWETITDYNRLATFVPGMTLSRQVSAPNAPAKLVEQRGEGGLLSFLLPEHVILEMKEVPYSRIGFRSVSGWLTSLQGEWVIKDTSPTVILGYRAHVVPAVPPPPMLTDDYIRNEISLRLNAVAREAERRMNSRQGSQ